jgi:hypothetical protein
MIPLVAIAAFVVIQLVGGMIMVLSPVTSRQPPKYLALFCRGTARLNNLEMGMLGLSNIIGAILLVEVVIIPILKAAKFH